MPESMTNQELLTEYERLENFCEVSQDKDDPEVLSAGEFMLDLHYEILERGLKT